MSNIIEYVSEQESFFLPAVADESIKWAKESQFAIQALQRNNYLATIADKNRVSLQNAIINVAAIGITLNPASKLAYLVPRDGGVCLDISYMGLLHLAMQTGSIRWGQCHIVHANDKFKRVGIDKAPVHEYGEFSDRGEPVGAYCVVKTSDGDYLTETMKRDDIYAIRDRSVAWRSYKSKGTSCPWVTDELEMWRKTVVKRGSKYWPKVERLDRAIDYLNSSNYEGIETEPVMPYVSDEQKSEQANKETGELRDKLNDLAFKMDNAESYEQLKGAFKEAFTITRDNAELNQQAQKIYQQNKTRMGLQ